MEKLESNKVVLNGEIKSNLQYSHHLFGEGFYEFNIAVKRLSEFYDVIPLTISERLLNDINIKCGNYITVTGQFRSYNKFDGEKSRLMLSVFVREILESYSLINPNNIDLCGYVCKEPIYRTTPFKREICDVLIAVNRSYNKSDYIPCIAWGRNARFVKTLKIGDKVSINGRIQSREYIKQTENEKISKIAYEVSVNKVFLLSENEDFYKEEKEDGYSNDEVACTEKD